MIFLHFLKDCYRKATEQSWLKIVKCVVHIKNEDLETMVILEFSFCQVFSKKLEKSYGFFIVLNFDLAVLLKKDSDYWNLITFWVETQNES